MMNMIDGEPKRDEPPKPEIVLIGLDATQYYLYKGDAHLNQLLLADGDFPRPVACINFASAIDAKMTMGDEYMPGEWWAVHPEIVQRLRDDKCLTETDA